MQKGFIGRTKEIEILQDTLDSHEAEMVAVIGRRRVGKTFLIKNVFEDRIIFEITGLLNKSKKDQLENFVTHIKLFADATLPVKQPTSWLATMLIN